MTIYSMPFFIYSWCVWCLRTFHQLCHQVVFPKWRTGTLWVPEVIYLSFRKQDCSTYPYRDHYTKEHFIKFAADSRKSGQWHEGHSHDHPPLPLCRRLQQQELPMQITRPGQGNSWQLPEPRHPLRLPQAQQPLGWATVFEHLCKNKYGLIPARTQYIPLQICLQAWSVIFFRAVPRKICNCDCVSNNII